MMLSRKALLPSALAEYSRFLQEFTNLALGVRLCASTVGWSGDDVERQGQILDVFCFGGIPYDTTLSHYPPPRRWYWP
ncbi:hypothetical protein [Almyronema epifaneia]|uniref:Uncharacterized protein n=1 Tax=Almyronema epifaneia S1 TaxID=2991925 RepID=A0ABW6IHT8_9CYAN